MINVLYDSDSQTMCSGTLIELDLMPIVWRGLNRRIIRQELCPSCMLHTLTFRDELSVPPSRVFLTTNLRRVTSQKGADLIYTETEA
jgi:hypothetical protein